MFPVLAETLARWLTWPEWISETELSPCCLEDFCEKCHSLMIDFLFYFIFKLKGQIAILCVSIQLQSFGWTFLILALMIRFLCVSRQRCHFQAKECWYLQTPGVFLFFFKINGERPHDSPWMMWVVCIICTTFGLILKWNASGWKLKTCNNLHNCR